MTDRIEKTIQLRAPVARVWRALTDTKEFGAWFGCLIDGGGFAVGQVAEGRNTHVGYEHMPWKVTVVAIEEPSRFAFTWTPYAVDPAVDYSGETPTLVEFQLVPIPSGTRLTVSESGFDRVPAGRREEAMRKHTSGWAAQLENIRTHVGG